jgi:hypothetical protein
LIKREKMCDRGVCPEAGGGVAARLGSGALRAEPATSSWKLASSEPEAGTNAVSGENVVFRWDCPLLAPSSPPPPTQAEVDAVCCNRLDIFSIIFGILIICFLLYLFNLICVGFYTSVYSEQLQDRSWFLVGTAILLLVILILAPIAYVKGYQGLAWVLVILFFVVKFCTDLYLADVYNHMSDTSLVYLERSGLMQDLKGGERKEARYTTWFELPASLFKRMEKGEEKKGEERKDEAVMSSCFPSRRPDA